jgi:hypothetical protein
MPSSPQKSYPRPSGTERCTAIGVSDEEYKRALKARKIALIEEVLTKLKIYKIALEEPSPACDLRHSQAAKEAHGCGDQRFKCKILKLRIETLEKRLNTIVKMNYNKAKRRYEEKLFRDAFVSSYEKKLRRTEEKIATGEPDVDAALEAIKTQYLAGKSFEQIAKEAREKEGSRENDML